MAVSPQCISTLVQDKQTIDFSQASSFAFAELVKENSSDLGTFNAALKIPIKNVPFGINLGAENRNLYSFLSDLKLGWSEEKSISIASQNLSEASVRAFEICVNGAKDNGVSAIAHDADQNAVTVSVSWDKFPGGPDHVNDGSIEILGGEFQSEFPATWESGQSRSFIVTRIGKEDIRITISIGGDSVSLLIAYTPELKSEFQNKKHPEENENPFRVANQGDGLAQSLTRTIQASEGWSIVPGSVRIEELVKVGNIITDVSNGVFERKTYARITDESVAQFSVEAQCYPLSKEGGGDLQFRCSYQEVRIWFE